MYNEMASRQIGGMHIPTPPPNGIQKLIYILAEGIFGILPNQFDLDLDT